MLVQQVYCQSSKRTCVSRIKACIMCLGPWIKASMRTHVSLQFWFWNGTLHHRWMVHHTTRMNRLIQKHLLIVVPQKICFTKINLITSVSTSLSICWSIHWFSYYLSLDQTVCQTIDLISRSSHPADIYLFIVDNRNMKTMREICPRLIIKTLNRTSFCRLYC